MDMKALWQVAARLLIGLFGLPALLGLGGCASTPPVVIPPGTLMIGEVMQVLTTEHLAAGVIVPGEAQGQLRQTLQVRGLSDDDVRRGRGSCCARCSTGTTRPPASSTTCW